MMSAAETQRNEKLVTRFGIAVGIGVFYGLMARLIFGWRSLDGFLNTLSFGFLLVVPVALGALMVYLGPRQLRTTWSYAFFGPWLPSALFFITALITLLEAAICLVMAAPIFFVATSIGGVIMCAVLRNIERQNPDSRTPHYALILLLIAPYLAGPIESQFRIEDSIRTVHTQIVVNASVDTVWQNIIRVPKIRDDEQRFSIFQLFGLPRPVEATLSHDGVGGMRGASYDNGLRFVEAVVEWDEHRMFRFTIKVDGNSPAPFNMIGGKAFDVIDATYVVEPQANGSVLLHLHSTERVSTHFNFYSSLWTDVIMTDLQNYILEIVKRRAEASQ
jgi:hypothetical protein